jgi:hypothetical protein
MTALEMIMDERERQISQKGYDAAHDDAHWNQQLLSAAGGYADAAAFEFLFGVPLPVSPNGWPWDDKLFKGTGGVEHLLIKSGALFQAEADRLRRKNGYQDQPGTSPYSQYLVRIIMAIDHVRSMTPRLDDSSLRVLKEIRDHHQAVVNECAVTMRIHNSAMEAERHQARLHESFVETLENVIRAEESREG